MSNSSSLYTYNIKLKIHTLAQCSVNFGDASFKIDGLNFSPWNIQNIWNQDAWLVETNIDAKNVDEARIEFRKKLNNIIPKIAIISQCYITDQGVPFLIHKQTSDVALFYHSNERPPCGLMFTEIERKALEELVQDKTIPNEFYYYWNDMINTIGYSGKLMLLCSALEALAKNKEGGKYPFLENILGSDLKGRLFERKTGLRHRLIHGEYFSLPLDNKNYLNQAYIKVIEYLNKEVLSEALINTDVTYPQRHFWGNKEGFGKPAPIKGKDFDFKKLVDICDQDKSGCINLSHEYEILQKIPSDY